MIKKKICPDCEARGYISHYEVHEEYGCHWDEHCKKCNGTGYIEAPITNADYIRSMSNEELAEFLHDIYRDGCEYATMLDTNWATEYITLDDMKQIMQEEYEGT